MEKNLKNVVVISFGFLLLFTAYGGLQSLQSSLHSDGGMGVASLSVVYGSLIISSMFLPPILIKKLGCKWTIAGSMCCYIAFSLGNFYASWYTLIPTSVILGLGGAPLWSAKCTYLTIAGNSYAQKSSGVWGNLISSLIFGQTPTQGKNITTQLNYLLVWLCSGILAVLLIAVFLDQIKASQPESNKEKTPSFLSTFLATLRHLKDKRQCLLIPLTMYSGFEQGFLAGDYTKSYVTCALGIHYVGYISQFTGRKALFALAAVTNLASIIALLLWKPHYQQLAVFFIFPALWGMADAIWQTQTNALYGVLFEKHKEAAFANYRLWESLGFVIAFGYSTFLQVYVKLYIVLAVLVVAMGMYGIVEYLERDNSSEALTTDLKKETTSSAQQTRL
uniref:Protein unc-93 homolog A n=1 Tax=Sphenodon punctatus TaxID=8508 RepID=A0A8D0G4F8_SPHPU